MVRSIGLAGAFSIFFWGILILGRTGKQVSYRGDDPAAIPRSVQWIGKRYIPAGATKIELSGRSTACKWSCQVSGQDFLKFKAECPFAFSKEERDHTGKGTGYLYENRHRNGGGITLRYDAENQRMTGFYSSH